MIDEFEKWVATNSNYWNTLGIVVDEIGRHPQHYLSQSTWIKLSTQTAFGQIQIWEGDKLFLMDFMAINIDEHDFYRHYEFVDAHDFDGWQKEFVSFMCEA